MIKFRINRAEQSFSILIVAPFTYELHSAEAKLLLYVGGDTDRNTKRYKSHYLRYYKSDTVSRNANLRSFQSISIGLRAIQRAAVTFNLKSQFFYFNLISRNDQFSKWYCHVRFRFLNFVQIKLLDVNLCERERKDREIPFTMFMCCKIRDDLQANKSEAKIKCRRKVFIRIEIKSIAELFSKTEANKKPQKSIERLLQMATNLGAKAMFARGRSAVNHIFWRLNVMRGHWSCSMCMGERLFHLMSA